jgi:hypothetical protein
MITRRRKVRQFTELQRAEVCGSAHNIYAYPRLARRF